MIRSTKTKWFGKLAVLAMIAITKTKTRRGSQVEALGAFVMATASAGDCCIVMRRSKTSLGKGARKLTHPGTRVPSMPRDTAPSNHYRRRNSHHDDHGKTMTKTILLVTLSRQNRMQRLVFVLWEPLAQYYWQ